MVGRKVGRERRERGIVVEEREGERYSGGRERERGREV